MHKLNIVFIYVWDIAIHDYLWQEVTHSPRAKQSRRDTQDNLVAIPSFTGIRISSINREQLHGIITLFTNQIGYYLGLSQKTPSFFYCHCAFCSFFPVYFSDLISMFWRGKKKTEDLLKLSFPLHKIWPLLFGMEGSYFCNLWGPVLFGGRTSKRLPLSGCSHLLTVSLT